jgi:raffinose/stachyose/melibiose transport system permease protein
VTATSTKKREESIAFWVLALPAVLIYLFIMAFPTIFSITLSLTNYTNGQLFASDTRMDFIGLKHYFAMFGDKYFWIALQNNIWIVAISVLGQIPLGFILAYVLYRKSVAWTGFWQTVLYIPVIISTIVVGILWQTIFSPIAGPITQTVRQFIPNWENTLMNDPNLAMVPVLFVILWMYTGTYMIIFLANLQRIDSSILEAARIDGANEGVILWRIIIPALSGVIVTSAILAISGSLKSFDLIFAMTSGGPAGQTSVLSLYMYNNAFKGAPDFGLANAISTFMVVVSFLLIGVTQMIERRFGGKEE